MTGKKQGFSWLCFVTLILAVLASALPAQSAEVRKTVLPKGLTVLVLENHSTPTVSISGYVRAGSVFDPPGKMEPLNSPAFTGQSPGTIS